MAVREIMLSLVLILRGRWTKMCGQYQMIMLCIRVSILSDSCPVDSNKTMIDHLLAISYSFSSNMA